MTPRVDASGWTLPIDGMVDNPLTLTYDDLLALPMIERDITLTCVSNEVGGPYVSTGTLARACRSREIIDRVGVQPGVDQVFSYSSDSGYTCSTPYAAVSDGRDAMIVVGLNGEVAARRRAASRPGCWCPACSASCRRPSGWSGSSSPPTPSAPRTGPSGTGPPTRRS